MAGLEKGVERGGKEKVRWKGGMYVTGFQSRFFLMRKQIGNEVIHPLRLASQAFGKGR